MSSVEWKPGTVAMVANDTAMRVEQDDDAYWVSPIGTRWRDVIPQRPLVVIDPEDREQVERLLKAFTDAWGGCAGGAGPAMQEALHGLVAPPKPEEPTGLGAVVEDQRGEKWIRATPRIADFDWFNADDPTRSRAWRNLPAVRVLSEGVTE